MKRTISLLLILFLLLGLAPAAWGDEIAYTGTVTGGTLNMRSAPSASAKVVMSYKSGTEVEILENDGTWCKVKKGNKTGYMMTQYLKIEANYPQIGWGVTAADGALLNLREKPDESSAIVLKCMSGTAFELVEEAGDYYKVRSGHIFGYIRKNRITLVEGNFAPCLSVSSEASQAAARVHTLEQAAKEAGSPLSRIQTQGDFTYSLSYPDLNLEEADAKIASWLQDSLARFEEDHAQNHAGEQGSFTVEYQALQVDERYVSVVLLGEYQVGNLRAETVLTLNADTEENRLLSTDDLFNEQTARVLFSLESGVTQLMSTPMDGYSGKPQMDWLQYAFLTRDGLAFHLPAGLFLPLPFGTSRISLPYSQVAESMKLDSDLIRQHIRVIDPTKPMIALTFDDGPSEQTERILNVLAQYGGKATFCVQGINVEKYADIVKRAVAEGHEIASHTWNHKKLTEISDANVRSQLQRTSDIVREVTGGYEIKVLRPPYGSTNKRVRNICAELDLVIAHWKLDTLDWETRSSSKTYRAIMKGAGNGVIVLCHDLYSSTASAIEKAVPELVAKGYQLVTVSELLSFHKDGAQPGTVYAYLDPENIDASK